MFVMTSIGGGEIIWKGEVLCKVKVPGKATKFNPESIWIFWLSEVQSMENIPSKTELAATQEVPTLKA